jgi:hypothetical protein
MNVAEEAWATAVRTTVAPYEEGRESFKKIEVAVKDRSISLRKSLIGFAVK